MFQTPQPSLFHDKVWQDFFVAIDFETADPLPDSACALGLIKVRQNRIVDKFSVLIRPPRKQFYFTHIHGISWEDVQSEPSFRELWPQICDWMGTPHFFVAHNAHFDRRVLEACCREADLFPPESPFYCSVQLSRRAWKLSSCSLPRVCKHLGISLNHHNAESDAQACAQIVIAARNSQNFNKIPWKPLGR